MFSAPMPWDNQEVPERHVLNEMLNKTKGQFFIHAPGAGFLGSLMCDHAIVWDEGCSTAWCNGETIGWSPEFFCWLTPKERLFILAHELWHTAYMHIPLMKTRQPRKLNHAADYVINHRLEDDGFECSRLKQYLLFDRQWDGMHTLEIYDQLPDDPLAPLLFGDDLHENDDLPIDQLMEKLVKAQQASKAAREAGIIPGEIEEAISNWLNPILPWETIFRRWMTEISDQTDWTMARPNRRYTEDYLPSQFHHDGGLANLHYYFDVSGSVSNDMLHRKFSEAAFVHKEFQPEKMSINTFDFVIQQSVTIRAEDDFDDFQVIGRGGTSLEPVLEHIKQEQPTAAVIFTDYCCADMSEDPGIPVVWVIVGNSGAKPPFGKVIHIREE